MKKTLLSSALCFELPAGAPDWVELLPAGPEVTGIDGRRFLNDQPQSILDVFDRLKAHGRDLPIDYEHASELKAPKGEPAPAAAWVVALALREGGSIWAKVEWTPKGQDMVTNREYRYLSPSLIYETATNRIVAINSVGLTNRPNFTLTALNHEDFTLPKETDTMKKIYQKLGLAETASEDEAVAAIGALQNNLAIANNRAESPSLDKFVPRADLDAALARATNAEQSLATAKQAEQETAINTAVTAAVQAGLITPATVEYHKANCRAEGGLARFQEFVKVAPVIGDKSGLEKKDPDPATSTALNAEQSTIAAMFGNTADDLKKYGA